MNKIYIYTLADENGNIRYVGKTNSPLIRYRNHLKESSLKSKSHKNNWIKSLIKKGELPLMEILDEVSEDDWIFWEMYWISQLKVWGYNLTNQTDGGENPPSYLGKTHSSEYKNIRREFMLSEKNPAKGGLSNEWKNKISLSNKGKKWTNKQMEDCSRNKSILQYTLNGDFIKEWSSASVASRELKISKNGISLTCRYERKKCGNFIWRYKGENFLIKIEPYFRKPKSS